MADNTNLSLTVEAWAKFVIERWEDKMLRLRIHNSGDLKRSLLQHVITQANGDPIKIEFAFNFYGKFVDMGVGKEFKIGNPGDIGLNPTRRAKPWYSKTFFSQVKKLSEILAEKYALKAQISIITNIEEANINSSSAQNHPKGARISNPSNRFTFIDSDGITRNWVRRKK